MSTILVYLLYLPVFCCRCCKQIKTLVWGCTEMPGWECLKHEIWIKEKTERLRCSYSNWGFQQWCWQMCRWIMAFPVHMHSSFPTRRSKQTIVTSWNDVTMTSYTILGGKYKREAHTSLGAVIWVFWYWMVVCFIYPYACIQTFWGTL